jgi:hypothetical protein
MGLVRLYFWWICHAFLWEKKGVEKRALEKKGSISTLRRTSPILRIESSRSVALQPAMLLLLAWPIIHRSQQQQ